MGLLDRMIRKGVNKAIGNAVSDAVSNAVGNAIGGAQNQSAPAQAGTPKFCPGCGAKLNSGVRFCGSCGAVISGGSAPANAAAPEAKKDKAFFAGVLAQEFGAYEVRENVSPAELGGSGKPYDFGLYRDGRMAGVVMLTQHNRDNNAAYKNAKRACEAAGVPFINFYLHMPNERGYVVSRIKGLL